MLSANTRRKVHGAAAVRAERKVKRSGSGFCLDSLRVIKKTYLVLSGAIVLTGVISTQFFQGRIEVTQKNLEQMQVVNQEIYDKNIALRAARAHLYSKDRIKGLAQSRFDLFEPDEKRQVHQIHM